MNLPLSSNLKSLGGMTCLFLHHTFTSFPLWVSTFICQIFFLLPLDNSYYSVFNFTAWFLCNSHHPIKPVNNFFTLNSEFFYLIFISMLRFADICLFRRHLTLFYEYFHSGCLYPLQSILTTLSFLHQLAYVTFINCLLSSL